MSLANIIEDSMPLFRSLRVPRGTPLKRVAPMVPNRIKFLYEPNDKQVLYPGVYFVIARSLSMSEMVTLEKATLAAIASNPTQPEEIALDVPDDLARKFADAPKPPALFNSFRYHRGALHMTGCRCLWVDPNQPLQVTDVRRPEYGTPIDLATCATLLQIVAASLGLFHAKPEISRYAVAQRNVEEIMLSSSGVRAAAKFFPRAGTQPQPVLFHVIASGVSMVLDEKTWQDTVSVLMGLMYCFYNTDTDISEYMEWE